MRYDALKNAVILSVDELFLPAEREGEHLSKVGRIGTEVFSHKMSQARYRAAG